MTLLSNYLEEAAEEAAEDLLALLAVEVVEVEAAEVGVVVAVKDSLP